MLSPLRTGLLAFCVGFALVVGAQEQDIKEAVNEARERFLSIDARDLQQGTTAVPGQGLAVPGVELSDKDWTRQMIGDDSAYAERMYVDSNWFAPEALADSVVPRGQVIWLRYHVEPDQELKDAPMLLNIQSSGALEIFLNGRSLFRSSTIPVPADTSALRPEEVNMSVPITFACDGQPEVLAVRIIDADGGPLDGTVLRLSLHAVDSTYAMNRTMMHFGVFIGVNIIILLLALVIWSLERKERSWLVLALLSLVSAVSTLCELGGTLGALGLSTSTQNALEVVENILMPWPMYLLIIVLGMMRGDLTRQRARRFTIAAIVVTLIIIMFSIALHIGTIDTSTGFAITEDHPALLIALVVLGLLFAVILTWFAIAVVRLGVRLLRSKGYARWIGGGALASSVLSLILQIISGLVGTGLAAWFEVISDYCSYVAVPVSVAVYLAIRSAHHNRLVARQRDDLDQEVKERTSQLSAEKERSDELLLNILPAEVAEELKRTGAAAARQFEQASVLFTDFKGFTEMSAQVGAADLLQELNTCFKAFDEIIGKRGVEKIKTIGDAYMCVGGLPDPTSSTPAAVVYAALELQAFMVARKTERDALGLTTFEMRVGIHSGPVVAGIVGVKKFQYDIWGDTVNTASRMESSGEVGEVNISESTYGLVKHDPGLSFTPRGKVQVKGKGEMEMFFVRRNIEGS